MLFDSLADRVLWLILVSDRKNRNKIIECINIIPSFVREQIVLAFQEYNASVDSVGVSGVAGISEGTLDYSILISNNEFKLWMFKSIPNENLVKETYEFSLILYSDDLIQWNVSERIGEFKYERHWLNNRGVFQIDETFNRYYLRNTSIGLMISIDDGVIPKIISSGSLNESKLNTLVRRRNRGSKY